MLNLMGTFNLILVAKLTEKQATPKALMVLRFMGGNLQLNNPGGFLCSVNTDTTMRQKQVFITAYLLHLNPKQK